jgi:hypothetical protein
VADSRLVLARRLVVAGLAIFAVYHIDEVARASGMKGFLPVDNPTVRGIVFELSTLLLSATAFALSWNRPSIIISMLLIVSGVLMITDGISIGTRYLTNLTVPGPVIGLVYGIALLSLGLAKGITTGIAMKTVARTT